MGEPPLHSIVDTVNLDNDAISVCHIHSQGFRLGFKVDSASIGIPTNGLQIAVAACEVTE